MYEQWGWPLPAEAQDAVRERLAGVPVVVVDRVDSADFFRTRRIFGAFEVVSLSKVLGLDAGGLARHGQDGPTCALRADLRSRAPSADHPRLRSHPAVRELFKQSDHVHPSVTAWLEDNCAVTALEAECRARETAVRLVLDSRLSQGWPAWMIQAIESGRRSSLGAGAAGSGSGGPLGHDREPRPVLGHLRGRAHVQLDGQPAVTALRASSLIGGVALPIHGRTVGGLGDVGGCRWVRELEGRDR